VATKRGKIPESRGSADPDRADEHDVVGAAEGAASIVAARARTQTRTASGSLSHSSPGRDAGHSEAASGGAEAEQKIETPPTLGVETGQDVKPPKATRATAKGKPGKAKVPAEKLDGAAAARGLMEMVELFAVAKFGPGALFSFSERIMIEAPLARLIEKYGNVAEQFSAIIDPALVIAGVAMYAIRLSTLPLQGEPGAKQPDQPKPPSTDNGKGPSTDTPMPTVTPELGAMFGGAFR
jgi:hypothetical protein